MRRVETEGDSQSSRRRARGTARPSLAQKPRLRRLALDRLEDRTLMAALPTSTLPTPLNNGQAFVGSGITSGAANSSSPSVAVDPLDPMKLVSAWTTNDPGTKLDGGNGQVTAYVQGAYSVDGGLSWLPLPNTLGFNGTDNGSGATDGDVQPDFSVAPPTGSPQPNFAQTTDATVAFGRNQQAYLLTSTRSGSGGVLDLQRWDFSTQVPAPLAYTSPAYDSLSGFAVPATINPIYRWQAADAAITPTLAVDNNVPTFTDGTSTQTDPFAGNVYVAWETQDTAPTNVTQNPNTIKLMSSSDGGQDFTYQAYLNGHAPGHTYDLPKLAISQGATGVPGGQVTVVYDDAGVSAVAPFFDNVFTQASTAGGTDVHADSPKNFPIPNAILNGGGQGIDTPGVASVPINVNVTDPGFNSVQNLTVSISLQYPTLTNTSVTLTSPPIPGFPGGRTFTLWNNATNAAGQAVNTGTTLTGANVGASMFGPYIGTVLDSTANRSIFDTSATAPYAAHFRPLVNFNPVTFQFDTLQSAFQGLTAAQITGTWTLTITDFRNETATTPRRLVGASLDFTSGNSDITNNPATLVTETFLNSGTHSFNNGIQAVPVFANPSIASDNTLGSNSPHQGRLYLALTNDNFNANSLAYTTSTFIELFVSDDGGNSWTYHGVVNDDNGIADGFSAGGYSQPGSVTGGSTPPLASTSYPNNPLIPFFGDPSANVRPKIDPQVAVDQQTGTLVVSFLDTRNDAAAVRVADYIAASTDGGATFAPETYANASKTAIDAITGNPVNLGPIPENQSSGSNNVEGTFGFGQSQGLAVSGGRIVPLWSSNQNAGSRQLNSKASLFIQSAELGYAAGPRVLSSTQGPVGEPGDTVNTTRAPDGSPIANTIVLNFDRAVDPATFPPDGPTNPIGTSPIQVFYNNPSGTAAPVPLRVLTVSADPTRTQYTITFDPAGHGVGTYTYTLRPTVRGMIPYKAILNVDAPQQIPFIDTAVTNEMTFTVTGHPGVPLTAASLASKVDIYQKGISTGSPTDLQIFLITADNTQYTLYSQTTQGRAQGVSFNVRPSITIPAIPAEMLDQTYRIRIVDNVPNEKVFLYNDVNANDFNFQIVLNNQTSSTVTGNFLDQNANGTPGQSTADNYSVPTGRNSLPLIVPGPHVVSTSVVGVNGTVSTGTDNLVVNDDARSINVTFDRDIRVATFDPSTVLSIVGPAGRIDGPQTFPSTGTTRTFGFNGPYQLIPRAGTLSSGILIANTGLNVSNLTVKVNITDPNDASLQLTLVAPDGTMVPLVAANSASGANFTNTVFSDSPAANGLSLGIPTAPAGSGAPYSLTYKPVTPLSALAGKAIDGTWKLQVTDSTITGAQGRLNAWSLTITPQVPQGGPGTFLDSSLVVSSFPDNSFTIGHLAVQLNISSTVDGQLQILLISPAGQVIPLTLSNGGSGSNFTNTIFDDNATIPIGQGTAPFSLSYKPAGASLTPPNPLAALNGQSIEGTWRLRILDSTVDSSVTTLNSWSLIATPKLTVTPVNPVNGVARTFTIGFPTQQLSGTYNIGLSPTIQSATADPTNPSVGAALDTNLNAGVDALRGVSNGVTTSDRFAATSVPVRIPYATRTPVGRDNGILTSQINVADNFAIQGDVGTLAGLTVSFNITYYNDPDLSATLTAPNGKSVTLFSNVGRGNTTADFQNTTLSDTVTPLAPITSAGAPFFGTFNPQFPLSAFTTDLMGNQAFSGGLWTLTITNVGLDPGAQIDLLHPPALLSWSLNFQKPQPGTGLGEAVADRKTVGFRLFNIAPNDPLSNSTWTAVGPAGTNAARNPNDVLGQSVGVNLAGPVSVVALDPSDPSGNTAYVGASSGGVWRTTNFLTTAAGGPNYVPLTDFGSNYSINIGGIAVFGRNNDPNQSIVFAGTGDGQATTANYGNSIQGVGILRSTDGGARFTLLDSTTNVDASGNPLPANSPLRDHAFVGSTTYKLVVDPKPLINGGGAGGVIVYAALGGKNGGLWRSTDGGNHWLLLRAGTATDVILDQASTSPSTGNLDILYAAFQGVGVFVSSNRGQALTMVTGTVGADNLIQNSLFVPAPPLLVNNPASPNGAFGRIILAKPALTNNADQNILYQDWLYAAVENANGSFRGLYVTKDRGENWTFIRDSSVPTANLAVTEALPTNDNTQANNYDATLGKTTSTHNGNSAFSLTVDPSNPNIIYLGGTQDYQTSGLIRLDLTGLYDAHAYVPFADNRNDGGQLTLDSLGRVDATAIQNGIPFFQGNNPLGLGTGFDYLNLRHSPIDPFNINATLFVYNSSHFTNDGTGVIWTPLDASYNLPAGGTPTTAGTNNVLHYSLPLQGSTNIHQIVSIVDPLTGLTRLIISDDQGVFTGLFNADGTLDTTGIGTAAAVNGSRNGNLQDEQLYYSSAQPSALAAQAAGALFYGSGIGMADAQSPSDLLSTGDLTWNVQSTSYGDLQAALGTNDRGGTGIATDPTGGVSPNNPGGIPSLYEYDVPFVGGDTTNFFRVNNAGQTTGLVNNFLAEYPLTNILSTGNGVTQLGNFAVNPINGSQILISSNLGNVYETTNKGVAWLPIGSGQADFDGTYAPAVVYGAPDPNAPNGLGNLNNFIYVGTVGGHAYVTQTGGGPWTSLSSGLDGSSVVQIFTNPNRGSHEAYAVTLKGVYYMADSIASASNPNPTWVNITGNLAQIQHTAFGSPALAENALLGYANGQLGGFRSIVADYRYAVPDPVVSTTTYPVLYVAGYGGVFRSLDNGSTWTAFPNQAFDTAPADGGYLPNVDVTSLDLNLGAINPATGHATQAPGDPVVLLATTLGRGDFAIRLAPTVFPTTVGLDPTLPAPGGSATGTVNGNPLLTNLVHPYISGTSEISNFGNVVTITVVDEATGIVIGTGTTDTFGHFSVMIGDLTGDPSFAVDGVKTVGVQATDSSGAKGNVTTFTYTLKATPPPNPTNLRLTNDSGRFNNDDISNLIPPIFTVNTSEPATTKVELFRFNSALPVGQQYELVDTQMAGVPTVTLTDRLLATDFMMPPPINMAFTYYAIQVDQATNPSTPLNNIGSDPTTLTITIDTILPTAPNAPTLDPSTNSGLVPSANITNFTHPLFNVTGLLAGDNLDLFRSINGSTPILVGTAAVGATQIRDTVGVPADGVYLYQAAQVDVAGNISPLSMGVVITINTQAPATPTIVLFPADDTGAPTHPDVTSIRTPRFVGVGTPGLGITIYIAGGAPITSTVTVAPDGTYLAQVTTPLADRVYTLVAKTVNAAGNISYSLPLNVTIKGTGPQILPTLSIFAADDTGVKGDDVTANRRPRFIGTTDPGVTVTLYALINGVLSAPQASTTSSAVNGSFTLQLPFQLTNGNTQLVAQATDIAGNRGPISPVLPVRIITVAGDYLNAGTAQLAVFRPTNETVYVRGVGGFAPDSTPGRDIPVQYDINGDGKIDPVSYRFNSAEYFGQLSSGASLDFQFGNGNSSLPVSGNYDSSGIFEYGLYNANSATWAILLPRPGGEVLQFGAAGIDIPVPAAYDGNGVTEIAVFRPVALGGNDADSFNVVMPNFSTAYQVSFTDPTVIAKGFSYKAGDIPAPADYDGVGKDEFAVYRPTTGQFFILKVPNPFDKSTWTLRTVTLNIPGGPRAGDQPVSEDYEGTGKASPAIFRPSTSTFYEVQSTNGIQQNVQFGQPGLDVASAGPLLYRLSALTGPFATTGGYSPGVAGLSVPGGSGGSVGKAALVSTGGPLVSTSTSTAGASPSSSALPGSSTIALAMPTTVVTAAPSAPVTVPIPTAPSPSSNAPVSTVFTKVLAPAVATSATSHKVTVGVAVPKAKAHTPARSAAHPAAHKPSTPTARPAAHKAAAPSKSLKVSGQSHVTQSAAHPVQIHSAAQIHVGPIKKARKND